MKRKTFKNRVYNNDTYIHPLGRKQNRLTLPVTAITVALSTTIPAFAIPITFDFGSITDNTVNTFSQQVGGVTITIENPQCVGGGGSINFRASTNGLHMEPVAETVNGECNLGAHLSASQFDIRFDKTVQFTSYMSNAWDGGTYELVVGGTAVSNGNTVGTSTAVTTGPHPFANSPTLAAGKTATFKMVPLTSPSTNGDGGKLKSITVDYQTSQTITLTYIPPPPPPETKVIVSFGGDGQGKVTSNPSGIDCQSPYACSYTFDTKETIQLTPQAVGQSRFQNWGNSCNSGTISASGKTVYCMVYFVDTTPTPIVEPTPVDNQPPIDVPLDNPTLPVDVPIDNQSSTDMPANNPTPPVDVPVDNQPPTDTPVDIPPVESPPETPVNPLPPTEEAPATEPQPEESVLPAETRPTELPPAVSNETCPPKDTLNYYCNAGGQTIGDLNIVENPQATNGVGFLSNAVIVGVVQLNPDTWIANLHVKSTGKVVGGVVTGLIYNEGYLGDFVFKGEFIKGGKLGGKILNLSKIFSWFEDVTLTSNAHLIGGALKGKIKGDPKKPALLENLRILSGSVVSGVIIGNGVKIDENVVIEDSTADVEPVDDTQLPALDEQFSAGIGVNDSSYQTRNVAQILSDNVSIRGKMHINQKHVGQKVKVFVTVSYRMSEESAEEFLFTINHLNGLMPWNGKKSSLGENPFREEILQMTHSVKIYDGILLATGVVNIQFGYISEDGTVVQSSEGIELVTLN